MEIVDDENEYDDGFWICDYCDKEIPDSNDGFRYSDKSDMCFCSNACCQNYVDQI